MGIDKETINLKNLGLKRLIKKHKASFRIPENLKYYSDKDFYLAEKKFLKYALYSGKMYQNK